MSMIPSYARFQSGGKAVAAPSTRRTVRVFPDAGPSNYNPDNNSVIRIELSPSLGFLDTVNSYLSFRVKAGDGVDLTKECRMDRNSMSWVQNMTLYSSTGAVLERLEDYNLLVNLLHKATTPEDYRSSIQQMIDNSGDRAVRNATMAHPEGSKFNSGFDCSGILGGQSKLLPCSYFQGPLVIELQLAPFADCFVGSTTSSGTLSYTIMDVAYHAQVLTFGEEYNSKMSQQVRSRGVDLSFDSYKRHETRLIGNSIETSISQNAASVKGVYHVLRDKDQYRSASHDSLSTYKSGNVREYQLDLGPKLYPEFPLKLDNDGYTDLYSQNLMSFNQFRNLSLGCEVDDTNFATCNPTKTANGLHSAGYKALPVRRIYGKWVVNSRDVFDPDKLDRKFVVNGDGIQTDANNGFQDAQIQQAVAGAGNPTGAELASMANLIATPNRITKKIDSGDPNPYLGGALADDNYLFYTHTVDTLHFVPANPLDAHIIQSGMKCKLGVGAVPAGEVSENGDDEMTLGSYGIDNLATQNYGLDRFYSSQPAEAFGTTDATGGSKSGNHLADSKAVMYPGAPTHITWGHTQAYADEKYTPLVASANQISAMHVSGLAVPFVDGLNRAICCKDAGGHMFEGWVEILPDDSSFFIGCSMESHPEENMAMVSGADLTNMTPLHVRLEYENVSAGDLNTFYAPKHDTDPFTTFVHVDSVLRLQPDGTLISSV